MKRHIVVALSMSALPFTSNAFAQKTISCNQNALIGYATKDLIEAGIEPTISTLVIYFPASFPNQASTKLVNGPLTMKCPGYTVSSTKSVLRVDGPPSRTFNLFTPSFKVGEFDAEVPIRRLLLAYSGDWIYPNIREDWIMQSFSATLKGGRLLFANEDDTYQSKFSDLVIGAKVNNGPLLPVFFDGKVTQVKHDGNDKVEIFVKGEAAVFDYLMIDFGKSVMRMKNGVPFPRK